jgi:hypothetical protein
MTLTAPQDHELREVPATDQAMRGDGPRQLPHQPRALAAARLPEHGAVSEPRKAGYQS